MVNPKAKRKNEKPVTPAAPPMGEITAAQERYRLLFNYSPVGILHMDECGLAVDCNDMLAEIMGADRKDIIGFDMLKGIRDDRMREALESAFRNGTGDFEGAYVSVTGEKDIYLRATFRCIVSENGETLGVVGIYEDITERKCFELELIERSHDLGERIKELNCLYAISNLGQKQGIRLDAFLKEVAELLPPAWQYPETTCARITVGDMTVITADFVETEWKQASPIVSEGDELGTIEVFYKEAKPSAAEGPFLREERYLLNTIAERVGGIIHNKQAMERILEYQSQLRFLASELALTEERERRRIATAVHDQIGHPLAIAKMKLGEIVDTSDLKSTVEVARLIEQAIHASRLITFELSPPVLHELGFEAALGWLVRRVKEEYGIDSEFIDDGWPKPLDEDTRLVLFRAVQELLVNAAKHAHAANVRVTSRRAGGKIQIDVDDNGVGFDTLKMEEENTEGTGFGLFSIRERLSQLRGTLDIESEPGYGTRVTLTVPIAREVQDELKTEQEAAPEAGKPLIEKTDVIRVLIVDDQQIMREGLYALLDKQEDITVVGQAADGRTAMKLARELAPDVVVMDVSLPDISGIEATQHIISEFPEIKVVAFSMHSDGQFVREMLRVGAKGYLLKDCAQGDLAHAIRTVKSNLMFLSPGIAENVLINAEKGGTGGLPQNRQKYDTAEELTPREREVLTLLTKGLNTKQIALKLGVSVKTIEAHRQHITEKLDMHSLAELTKYAIREGLTELED